MSYKFVIVSKAMAGHSFLMFGTIISRVDSERHATARLQRAYHSLYRADADD